MIPSETYLVLSAAVFCIGLFGILTRRNALLFLMSVELMLNAANINLVAFSYFGGTLRARRSGCSPWHSPPRKSQSVSGSSWCCTATSRRRCDRSDDDEVVQMAAFTFVPAIVLLPFVSFLVALFAGDRMPKGGALAGITATGGSLLLSIWVALTVAGGGTLRYCTRGPSVESFG